MKQNETRLDLYLMQIYPNLTRSHIKNLIEKGKVEVDGVVVTKAGYAISPKSAVKTSGFDNVETLNAVAEDIAIDVVYENADMLVINKPKGMVVHPAVKNTTGTLVNALLYNVKDLSGINGVLRPGIVHRLDKDTSGLMVVAKNDFAHVNLSKQIASKECRRIYISVCEGAMTGEGEIENYLARSKKNRLKFACNNSGEGKYAHSLYRVIYSNDKFSLVMWELKTGRTHQIRAHSEFIHHPIVGDKLYGSKTSSYAQYGQMLHAYKLVLNNPRDGKTHEFRCKAPKVFDDCVQNLLGISDVYDIIESV